MTRETKVGLVVGLGVILLVGIFVSDYLRIDQPQDSTLSGSIADGFNNGISNQPAMAQTPAAEAESPMLGHETAAAMLEEIEREHGTPTRQDQRADRDSHRVGPGQGFGSQRAERMGEAIAGRIPATDPRELFAQPPPVAPHELQNLDPIHDPIQDGVVTETPPTQEDPVMRPAPPAIRHTVLERETLSGIARQYYEGNSNMWLSIRDANKDLVGAEGQVRVGSVLVIPMRSEGSSDRPQQAEIHDQNNRNGNGTSPRLVVTVKSGDTLSDLAQTHLGSAGKWQLLMDANSDQLTTDRDLRIGMRLRIPMDEMVTIAQDANDALQQETQTQSDDRETQTTQQSPAMQTYTVQSGDSLYAIAAKTLGNGNRYDEIFQANRDQLSSADDIAEGMVLKIPNTTTASSR